MLHNDTISLIQNQTKYYYGDLQCQMWCVLVILAPVPPVKRLYANICHLLPSLFPGFHECLSNKPNCVSSFDVLHKFSCPARGRFTHTRNATMYFRCISSDHVACECACPPGRWFDDLVRSCRKHRLNRGKHPHISPTASYDLSHQAKDKVWVWSAYRQAGPVERIDRLDLGRAEAVGWSSMAKAWRGSKAETGSSSHSSASRPKPSTTTTTTTTSTTTSRPTTTTTTTTTTTSSTTAQTTTTEIVEKEQGARRRHRHRHGKKRHHTENIELKPRYNDLDKEPHSDAILDDNKGFRYMAMAGDVVKPHGSETAPGKDSEDIKTAMPTVAPSTTTTTVKATPHPSSSATHPKPKANHSILDRDVYFQRWVPNQLDLPRAERLVGVPNLGLQLYDDDSPVPAWAVALMALCLVILLVIIVLVMY